MTSLNQHFRIPTIEYDFGPSLQSINFNLSKTHIDSKQELNSLAYSLSIESIDLPEKQLNEGFSTFRNSNTPQVHQNNLENVSFRKRAFSLGRQTREKKQFKHGQNLANEPVSMISMLKEKNKRVLKMSTDRPVLTPRKNIKNSVRPKLFSTCMSSSKENSGDNQYSELLKVKLGVSGVKNVTFPRISERTYRMRGVNQNKKCKANQEESSKETRTRGNSKICLQIRKLKSVVC